VSVNPAGGVPEEKPPGCGDGAAVGDVFGACNRAEDRIKPMRH
jgi:hypothetical protein